MDAKDARKRQPIAAGGSCLDTSHDACSPDAFALFLKYERERVNRNGGQFALVLWDLGSSPRSPAYFRLIFSRLRESMRSVDLLGWIDADSVGVLLPDTSDEGANTFARHAAQIISHEAPSPVYSVLSYPKSWDETIRPLWSNDGRGKGPGASEQDHPSEQGNGTWHPASAGPKGPVDLFQRIFPRPVPWWKRLLDLTGSVIGLVVLSPLFALIAVFIKCISPGKVLFRQRRVGHGGTSFVFFKFRTMHENCADGTHREHLARLIHGEAPMAKLDGRKDSRVFPGGGFLRRTSLDELPQLWNVLRGEMSLVGPRPCIPYEALEFLRWHSTRFDILPGMSGLWQVSGKNRLSFEEMIRLDITYARGMSLLSDLVILLRTIPTVFGLVWEAVREKGRRSIAARRAGGDMEGKRYSHV